MKSISTEKLLKINGKYNNWTYMKESGLIHREDGPAMFWGNSTNATYQYFLDGHYFNNIDEWNWCVKNLEHVEISKAENRDGPWKTSLIITNDKLDIEYRLKFG